MRQVEGREQTKTRDQYVANTFIPTSLGFGRKTRDLPATISIENADNGSPTDKQTDDIQRASAHQAPQITIEPVDFTTADGQWRNPPPGKPPGQEDQTHQPATQLQNMRHSPRPTWPHPVFVPGTTIPLPQPHITTVAQGTPCFETTLIYQNNIRTLPLTRQQLHEVETLAAGMSRATPITIITRSVPATNPNERPNAVTDIALPFLTVSIRRNPAYQLGTSPNNGTSSAHQPPPDNHNKTTTTATHDTEPTQTPSPDHGLQNQSAASL